MSKRSVSVILPEPNEVRDLMNQVSALAEEWGARLAALGNAYGVHGDPVDIGNLTFRVTRVGAVWGLYCFWYAAKEPTIIGSCRVDEKIAFIHVAKEMEVAYKQRILDVYRAAKDRIKNLSEGGP